ncbi:hypothetical protein Ahy_Scaffold2g107611 isoform C [Arachis hypogaea]|uniref:P-type ATPase A domain-containing protein n=1 Tax=Arachis hypogaea TaxID=3818 RepID=A0A444WQG0_ARAHY|nr:hypothetical protein Ahy_Scaffold2g107611 isoform C [Arachis hypogaea]
MISSTISSIQWLLLLLVASLAVLLDVLVAVMQVIFFLLPLLRNGHRNEQDAAILVPGDIINIKLGDIIPDDACLLKGNPLSFD